MGHAKRKPITPPTDGVLAYDPDRHVYSLEGVVIPSVTQCLQLAGLTPNFWYDKTTRDLAAERGKLVHLACEFLDDGVLDWTTLDPILVPFVRAYEAFKADTGFQVHQNEHQGWGAQKIENEWLPFGYTLDRVGHWRGKDGKHPDDGIFDLKTGADIKPAMGVQLGGYGLGFYDSDGDSFALPGITRVVVQLRPDDRKTGTGKPYRLYEYDAASDYAAFRWALGIAWWKLRAGFLLPSDVDEPES
jgi:hypothetical protein